MNHNDGTIRVVIAGSGNVAEALALAAAEREGIELAQIAARNASRAAEIADAAGCAWTDDLARAAEADMYIIAVSDRAVGEVAEALRRSDGSTLVHTAGSVAIDVLRAARSPRAADTESSTPFRPSPRGARSTCGRYRSSSKGPTPTPSGASGAWRGF